ncbi:glycoside hydrolase family 73 protein [Caproiciproducens sp. MSJ-32]|uniref:glycoside hydrolase family 73 protein n=1 Tax=Caproiciproducens sp. MSJ-32 TaxID=2841527 RepID=UPI001C11610B|nr:glucosaminidase domain-containing protein [Caproiciproducens sp. MSJ-32]MBU5455113.1 glucosaminidase domain-containing protein [Caproiciproducens sp. MSJ-32]
MREIGTYKGLESYKIISNRRNTKRKLIIILIVFIFFTLSFIFTFSILSKNRKNETIVSKEEFIEMLKEGALANYKKYGILPSITIAQAIVESDFGESTLAREYYNLFGIKADESYTGEVVAFETMENYEDRIIANFRAYDSYKASIKDHGKFLYENSRYAENGLFDSKDYKGQAEALEKAGYATVKNENGELIYADILIEVIEEYKLYEIDEQL